MEFFVNDQCIGCGMCASTCPFVFEMTDEGTAHALDEKVPAEYEVDAQAAMNGCPVNAIEEK